MITDVTLYCIRFHKGLLSREIGEYLEVNCYFKYKIITVVMQ